MDLGLDRDWFTSFEKYQLLLREEFDKIGQKYDFQVVDADGALERIQSSLREALEEVLQASYKAPAEQPVPEISKAPSHMNLELS